MNEKLNDAHQFLVACDWSLLVTQDNTNTKPSYIVVDPNGVQRRSFIPVDRLYDYARGVFDSKEFRND